jgi:dephospho-CoA kinase
VKKKKVLDRMRHQMDEKEKISRCDFVIQNDGNTALLPQVLRIHEKLMEVWKTGSLED